MAVIRIAGRPGADALHVVVVAFLGQADLVLEAQNLLSVLAELAVHQVLAGQDFLDPFGEIVEHGRVVAQVRRLDEVDLRMTGRHHVGVMIDAFHQNAGEEEIGKNDDAAITQLGRVLQARLHERER